MVDYKEMYAVLFRAQTAAIELQEQATIILKVAQQKTEEMYIEASDPDIRVVEPDTAEDGEPADGLCPEQE